MRRRVTVNPDAAPARLLRFDADDWAGAACSVCAFYDARSQWAESHEGSALDAAEAVDWPDDPWECASRSIW